MGFKTPEDTTVVKGNFKKSTAFINLWLPSNTETGKKKFGTIYLDDDQEDEAALIDFLKASDDNLVTLMNTMIVDFKLAKVAGSGTGFILPTAETAESTTG